MTSLEVQTAYGPISGYYDTHPLSDVSTAALAPGSSAPVAKWLGVPYAQSTRFSNATAPAKWTESLAAKEFGSMFPQAPSGTDAIYGGGKPGVFKREWVKQSEDSHTVNIFAPADMTPGEKLPVLVRAFHVDPLLTSISLLIHFLNRSGSTAARLTTDQRIDSFTTPPSGSDVKRRRRESDSSSLREITASTSLASSAAPTCLPIRRMD